MLDRQSPIANGQRPIAKSQLPDFQLKLTTDKGITYLTSPVLQEHSIFLAFTTRHSGFSNEPYKSLNLALHVEDNEKKVLKNRHVVSKVLGYKENSLTCAQQIHGTSIQLVDDKSVGAGSTDYATSLKGIDGLITDKANVPIGLFFADCLPVVLVSSSPKIVAIAHAGYKGIISGIINKLIKKISVRVQPKEMLAFLGPSIGSCCYKVNERRVKRFSKAFPSIVKESDKALDLKAIASYQLYKAGLDPANIFCSSYCTCCNSDLFFSYRKSKVTGRQAAIAFIMG